MPTVDPRIDAYIKSAAPFARPILIHLRTIVRTSCPDAQETMKCGRIQLLEGPASFGEAAQSRREGDGAVRPHHIDRRPAERQDALAPDQNRGEAQRRGREGE